MKPAVRIVWVVALLAILAGYGWYGQRQQRAQLTAQLLELISTLDAENAAATEQARYTVKGIEVSVAKNERQPREVAVWHSCEALLARTQALADRLHGVRDSLRRAGGEGWGNQPGASAWSASVWLPRATLAPAQQQQLAQEFSRYQAQLPAGIADTLRVPAPALHNRPLPLALAALAQTECRLLAAQQVLLRRCARQVGSTDLFKHLIAVAIPEAAAVRPGATYRARLFLVNQLSSATRAMRMQCNGQPITVDQRGIGKVRFTAPTKPGPAAWTGTIRYRHDGRDTTFQVWVPYRVARP